MNRPPLPKAADVVIVGAGISGLACARRLVEKGRDTLVVDSADAVGGRIRTDEVDGFLLDRGFQVLLTAYEEFQKQFDPTDLDLKRFTPGSVVWTGGSLEVLGDPFRNPASALASARARVGSIDDKLRVARLRRQLLSSPAEAAFEGTDRSTLDELRSEGFSDDFIDTFFRPFMGGVFLERALETSARLFRYYFRCFAEGDAAVPARGMQRLPEQLAQPLQDRVLLNTTVRDVKSGRVTLDDGSEIRTNDIVLATDAQSAAHLRRSIAPDFKATVTSYFAAPEAPISAAMLVLDGEGSGPANHVAVMSNVSVAYAPEGQHLIAVSGVDAAADDPDGFPADARSQLERWFGPAVDGWEHLKTYHIPHALPKHPVGFAASRAPRRDEPGIWVTGDYTDFGAIQGALRSGRTTAEAILETERRESS